MSAFRSRVVRRRTLVGGALAAVVVAGVLAIVLADPFGGPGASAGNGIDNGTPISYQSVTRQDLSQQTQVSATLGYADPTTIAVPAGTAPSALLQARQQSDTASAALASAQATLAADARALAQAQATLAADRAKQAADCSGASAAQVPAAGGGGSGGGGSSPCASDVQAVAADLAAVTSASTKVDSDRRAVASARTSLAAAQQGLSESASSAAVYGQTSVYTSLPAVGAVVRRGQELYAIDGEPVLLLYGSATAWRAFAAGMSPGRDVAELNANLRALGYGSPAGDAFSADTAAAIRALQSAHGLAQTGELPLGSVAFEPGAVRVTDVTPTAGSPVQAGKVLDVTSMRREVAIELDASQQTSVKVGDPVTITLPDNSTTPGRVSYVGTVATAPASSGQNGGSDSPTIEVDVTPLRPAATGRLDQAPVDVSITTATVRNVLAVPVNALLALASGGYAVEAAGAGGVHRLVPVSLGLFDDAAGLVQVSGSGVAQGLRVVVPAE